MTPEQRILIEDKSDLWRRASKEGSMELRDYSRRAAEAIDALLNERDDLLAVVLDMFENPQFVVSIGGNPIMVDALLARAQAALAKAKDQVNG